MPKNDNSFSLVTPETDGRYMELASNQNRTDSENNELHQMVIQAARNSGFRTDDVLYHGTGSSFSRFKAGGGQYGPGIYVTYDVDAAKIYGNRADCR